MMHLPKSTKESLSTAALIAAFFAVIYFRYDLGTAVRATAGVGYFLVLLVASAALLTGIATRQAKASGLEWFALAYAAAYVLASLFIGGGKLALLTALGVGTGLIVWTVTWMFLQGHGR